MLSATIDANRAVLHQGADLLEALGCERYGSPQPAVFNSSAGGHIRHVIEHYQSFLEGLGSGEIDYEKRARDTRLETDAGLAARTLRKLAAHLETLVLFSDEGLLRVQAEQARAEGVRGSAGSSVVRELEFLLSHTVHHYALVAVICRLAGHEPPRDFGVAPSTARHLAARTG